MRIIKAIFSDRNEYFSSLKPFFEKYPQYECFKDKIDYALSRKKQPYKHEEFELQRINVFK
jgi:hypothetical protein